MLALPRRRSLHSRDPAHEELDCPDKGSSCATAAVAAIRPRSRKIATWRNHSLAANLFQSRRPMMQKVPKYSNHRGNTYGAVWCAQTLTDTPRCMARRPPFVPNAKQQAEMAENIKEPRN